MSFIAMGCEVPFLYENSTKKTQDSGVVSGTLVSSILAISWLFSSPMNISSIFISVILTSIGIITRITSKIYLGDNFSHSLKIDTQHKLVTSGIYSKIRHPAYLGTIMIISGIAFALTIKFYLIILLLVFTFAEIRIAKEEKMMTKRFGTAYSEYIVKTKRYMPYVY